MTSIEAWPVEGVDEIIEGTDLGALVAALELVDGDVVLVTSKVVSKAEGRVRSGDRELVYRITRTRSTSFRSQESLARQSAPVPGRPGIAPTRAMLTLSTCATPEDHAAGNFWSDEFDNPEHRIDKIGVLVRERPVG